MVCQRGRERKGSSPIIMFDSTDIHFLNTVFLIAGFKLIRFNHYCIQANNNGDTFE